MLNVVKAAPGPIGLHANCGNGETVFLGIRGFKDHWMGAVPVRIARPLWHPTPPSAGSGTGRQVNFAAFSSATDANNDPPEGASSTFEANLRVPGWSPMR